MIYPENISKEEIEALPLATFSGPITVIYEKGVDYTDAIEYLENQQIIGFDTETRPCFQANVARPKLALLQLSGGDKAFLFRLQKLKLPSSLAKILSDPNIIKVGVAIHDDINAIQKYKKFTPGGFIDLQQIVESYGIKGKSLKKMSGIVMGVKISKAQQLSNWDAKVLSGAQLTYAAIDAWVCREIYLKLTAGE